MVKHYVYFHYEDDEIVYIGMGKGGRCWDTHGSRRNSDHKNWMLSQLPYLNYKIVFVSENRKEVLLKEKEFIKKLKPKFNIGYERVLTQEQLIMHTEQMRNINLKRKTCTHCQRDFNLGMYSRWHGDNCKQRKTNG